MSDVRENGEELRKIVTNALLLYSGVGPKDMIFANCPICSNWKTTDLAANAVRGVARHLLLDHPGSKEREILIASAMLQEPPDCIGLQLCDEDVEAALFERLMRGEVTEDYKPLIARIFPARRF